MKIAFIAPEFIPAIGGIGTYSATLLKEMAKNNNMEIHVFTPNRARSEKDSLELDEIKKNVNVHFVSNARGSFFFNLWFQKKLSRVFRQVDAQNNFDLIHSANLAGVPDIFLKLASVKTPSIVTAHSTIETQLKGIVDSKTGFSGLQNSEKGTVLFYNAISTLQGFYLKRTDSVISVSDYVKNRLLESDPALGKKMFVVKNGIDTKKFCPKKVPAGFLPEEFSGKKKILFFGRLLALKGIGTLLDAAQIILSRNKNACFVFAGTGESCFWKKKAKKNRVLENCLFLDRIAHDDVPLLLNEASIVVLPSFSESFPLTILEAMACEKPVVASRVGGIPEIVSHKKDGLLFEAGNAADLAEKIIELLENKDLADSLGANARKKVLKEFSAEKMASETFGVYKKVLSR